MKKTILLITLFIIIFCADAQTNKKTRHSADNSSENVSARKISNQFNNGLRSFYTAQYEDAERIFSIIIGNNPSHAPSYYMLSKVYSAKNLYTDAENILNKAIKYDKNNIWYKVALGETLLKTENYKKATPVWESICKELPNNEIYLYNLYECYQKLGNYAKMIETMNIIEDKFGVREEVTRKKVAIWLSKNNISSALHEYDILIEKQPFNASNYLKAGLLCEEQKLHDKALTYYEKAYSLFPENADVNMTLANFWILRSDDEKSAKYIAYLIPNPNVDIEKKMPFMRKQLTNADNSNITKLESLAHQLETAHPDNALTYEILGKVSNFKKDYAQASEYFQKSLKIDDSNIDIWNDFIFSSEKSHNLKKILGFEEEIITLFPQSPKMLSVLASAFLGDNNADKAIEYYKNALAFAYEADDISAINKGLYNAYMMKGDTENAIKYSK